MMKRKQILSWLLAFALLLGALFAGTQISMADEEEVEKGGVLTLSLSSSPRNLDPVLYTGTYESKIINCIADTLVVYNSDLSEIVPLLAESWDVSEDGKTYVFTIRQGVHFHEGKYQEGREMTAEDVAYSLNRSAEKSAMNRLAMLKKAEVTDDWTVTCTLKEPNSSFLTALTDAGNVIVPEEEVEGWGDQFGNHLIGTGPFVLEEFKLDEEAVLKKNPNYWVAEPNLDSLVFKIITDANQAVNALQAGDIDMATDISGEPVEVVRKDDNLTLLETPALHIAYIYFNQVNGPTADKKVREALIRAVNVDDMVAAIYQFGEAKPAKLPLPPGSWGYDADLEDLVPTYDPELAKQLLAEAGYPDGFDCEIYISNTKLREKMATLLQAYLKANLNVNLNINMSEWGTFSEIASSGNADIYAMSWTWYPDPYFFLNKLFATEEVGALGNGQGFSNEEVDKLLQEALEVTDQDERAGYYKKALKLITEEYPGIFYANENITYGANKQIQDFVQRPDGTVKFVTSENNVWLKTK